jgi:hypothetical protein
VPTPAPEILQLLAAFAVAFTVPTFANARVLLSGAILAPGRRTVTAALRAMGLADDPHFTNYHRVLNRAQWSMWIVSCILLQLIIRMCLPAGAPLLLVVDETLERRRGAKIKYKGWFRDPLRSTATQVTKALGIRGIVLAILVPVPWSQRLWALPFMAIPALGPKTSTKLNKRHRTVVDWAAFMIQKVRRWQPEREVILVGDGTYAAVPLVQRCQRFQQPVKLVSRLRLDARLFDPPGPQPKSKRGPKPKKGLRQPTLAARLSDPTTNWSEMTVTWYGSVQKTLEFITGTSLWHRQGYDPVPVRWVLVRDPEGKSKPEAYFCSDQTVTAMQIMAWVIARWNIEVTFEEARAHLGFETQRQWSDRAIERTSPCLLGLFSLVVLMAQTLHPETLPTQQTAWYVKVEATFSDALAAVRRDLWGRANYDTSSSDDNQTLILQPMLRSLLDIACYST